MLWLTSSPHNTQTSAVTAHTLHMAPQSCTSLMVLILLVFHGQDQSEHKRNSRVLGKSTVLSLAVTGKNLLISDQYLFGQLKTSE